MHALIWNGSEDWQGMGVLGLLEIEVQDHQCGSEGCFKALQTLLSLSEGSLGASYMQVPMLCGFVAFALRIHGLRFRRFLLCT